MSGNDSNAFTFKIIEHVCVLGKGKKEGYTRELNIVSFRGLPPKWDIRDWNDDHTSMSKGITLTDDELRQICEGMEARGFSPGCGECDGLFGDEAETHEPTLL